MATKSILKTVHIKDSETGEGSWVNTDSRAVRESYAGWFRRLAEEEKRLFNRYKVDNVDISTDSDYVRGLMSLFAAR